MELDKEFESYLEMVGLTKKNMPAVQYNEIKRAFMAGCSSVLMEVYNKLLRSTDDDIIASISNWKSQLFDFWQKENNSQN